MRYHRVSCGLEVALLRRTSTISCRKVSTAPHADFVIPMSLWGGRGGSAVAPSCNKVSAALNVFNLKGPLHP